MPWTSFGAHKRVICFLPSTILSGARRVHPRNTTALTFCDRIRRFGFCIVLLTTGAFAQNTFPATGNVGIGTTTPGSDVTMTGGLTINGTSNTQLSVQQNNVSGFALNVGDAGPGSWSMYDKVGGNWTRSITSSGGNVVHWGLMSTTGTASPGVTSGIVSYFGTSSPLVAWDAVTAQVTNPSTANGTVFNGYSSTPAINVTDGISRIVIGGAFSPSLAATGGSTSSIYGINSNATLGSPSATGGYTDLYGGAFSAGTSPTAPTATTVTNVAGIKSGVMIDSGSVGTTRGLLVESSFGSTSGPANVRIPTYYGLQLTAPTYANGASITNNYGISQEDSVAKNYLAGHVGIGTANPGAALEVNGTGIKLTAGSGGSITFQDGTTQSTAWNGVLSGGDYAESVNVSGGREEYEPGDVLVIDPTSEGNFLKSSVPYSTSVTGIYSTKPGLVGRRQLTARAHMKEEVPMAMTGIVPTKVSAENGPIKPGDLLVTSSKPGYAMKGTDRTQMLGAVIGKAIGHLDSGFGVIEAVVTLQ
jgi:hypothetical protein